VLDFPAAAARRGIRRIHLCHFHVASRYRTWLEEFRSGLSDAGVALSMLLIDDGDIAHPTEYTRDVAWVRDWIDTAALLGAETARVIAGKQKPSPDALRRAAEGLETLVRHGASTGVKVATENWHDLLQGPSEVEFVLDAFGGELGFLADFGNWKGPGKYTDLARVMPRATDTHAKASFDGPRQIDGEDFGRCVDLAVAAGYEGPYTLIYDSADADEWGSIEIERRFVTDRVAAASAVTA
jgi:sugar phosphate isomerase/epimerase